MPELAAWGGIPPGLFDHVGTPTYIQLLVPPLTPPHMMDVLWSSVGDRAREAARKQLYTEALRTALDRKRMGLWSTPLPARPLELLARAKRRAELVERWQTGDAPLFLISLKAGGTGLNLTAADYVLHLDPWWNPAVEDQASDRAHRIGQDKPVTVVRFVSQGTIEQAVLELHEQKRALAEGLLASDGGVTRFSPEELMTLLQSDGDVERDEETAPRPAVARVKPAKKSAKTTKRDTTRTSPRARAINTRTAQGRQEYDRAVLEAVRSFDHPASAAELRELTGGTPLQLRASLTRLGTEGLVTCRGNARATRYRATL